MDEEQPFRVRDGVTAGLSVGRMRGATFSAPHWGIRATQEPHGHVALALAFAPRLPDRAFFCARTAAELWRMPLPATPATRSLDVGVAAGSRRVDAHGVHAHHLTLREDDVVRYRGVTVTTIERTWCDLAATGLTLAQLVAAGDFLIWHKNPLSSRGHLTRAVEKYPGRRGSRLIRTGLGLLSERADSAPESELRMAMHLAGLPQPQINHPVHDAQGRFLAQPDFVWEEPRVVLEYEGDHHRTDRQQWQKDLARFARLQEAGWLCLRATAADYRSPDRLITQLSRILTARTS